MNILKLHFIIHSSIILLHCAHIRASENDEPWVPSQHECESWEEKCSDNIYGSSNFNVTDDVEKLNSSLYQETMINILTKRSLNQRLLIAEKYREHYGLDLSETFADYEYNVKTIALALMKPLDKFFANELREAVKSSGKKHLNVLDILGPLSNRGIKAVAETFMAEKNMTMHIYLQKKLNLKGDHYNLFRSFSLGSRVEGTTKNIKLLSEDSEKLRVALNGQSLEQEVMNIILNRNNVQLRLLYIEFIFEESNYLKKRLCKGYLTYGNELRSSLCAMYEITQNRATYFAKRLHSSLNGHFKIDLNTIKRIFVGRSGIDLQNIKRAYCDKYNTTLYDKIKNKTSGLFQRILTDMIS